MKNYLKIDEETFKEHLSQERSDPDNGIIIVKLFT